MYKLFNIDCFFEDNVKATDEETQVYADNLDLLASEDLARIYNNVFVTNDQSYLKADKIDYDFEKKKLPNPTRKVPTNRVHKLAIRPIFCQNFTTFSRRILAKDGLQKRPKASPICNANFEGVRKWLKSQRQGLIIQPWRWQTTEESTFNTPEAKF